MRKYLLSTSSLAGAALLSSVAVADVNVSGYMEWEMISGDTDNAATDGTSMAQNSEVNIDFTNKTDSGLTITLNTDFDSDTSAVDNQVLIEINEKIRNHPVEIIGKELRKSMTSMKKISG